MVCAVTVLLRRPPCLGVGSIPAGHVLGVNKLFYQRVPRLSSHVSACLRPRDRHTTRQTSLQAEKKRWPETREHIYVQLSIKVQARFEDRARRAVAAVHRDWRIPPAVTAHGC